MILKERRAKTGVRIRRVLVEDVRVPGSTLVSYVKGKQRQGFESAECWWRMAVYRVRIWLVILKERRAKTGVRIRRVLVEDVRVPGSTLVSSVKGKEGKDRGSNPPSAGG